MATARPWIIVVLDQNPKRWPPAAQLVQVGVPVAVAARYAEIRRQFTPKGLQRRARQWTN